MYADPKVVAGNWLDVVIRSEPAATVIVSVLVPIAPLASVACNVIVKLPCCVGVPESVTGLAVALNVNPGTVPLVIFHV